MKKLTYRRHATKWKKCTRCHLCDTRTNVVLARGVLPADMLVIGEAPGLSEDTLGKPFIGPAGKLLDSIILKALVEYSNTRILFTNLIGCIPLDDEGNKSPQPEHINACRGRLVQIVKLAKPNLVVYAGRLAEKWGPMAVEKSGCGEHKALNIVHPAAILRTDDSQKGLLIQRTIVSIRDAVESIPPF